jgi:hypothetical protein
VAFEDQLCKLGSTQATQETIKKVLGTLGVGGTAVGAWEVIR